MARILLIDDETEFRQTIRLMLEQAGHEVLEAGNGTDGVEMHKSMDPDLIITDIIMPQKEGIETILALRRHDAKARIIAISGGGRLKMADFLTVARKFGASHTLAKPFRREQLLEAVRECLAGPVPAA
ncbi:MAG: response regulator [Kiloniellaceae bacterium]